MMKNADVIELVAKFEAMLNRYEQKLADYKLVHESLDVGTIGVDARAPDDKPVTASDTKAKQQSAYNAAGEACSVPMSSWAKHLEHAEAIDQAKPPEYALEIRDYGHVATFSKRWANTSYEMFELPTKVLEHLVRKDFGSDTIEAMHKTINSQTAEIAELKQAAKVDRFHLVTKGVQIDTLQHQLRAKDLHIEAQSHEYRATKQAHEAQMSSLSRHYARAWQTAPPPKTETYTELVDVIRTLTKRHDSVEVMYSQVACVHDVPRSVVDPDFIVESARKLRDFQKTTKWTWADSVLLGCLVLVIAAFGGGIGYALS